MKFFNGPVPSWLSVILQPSHWKRTNPGSRLKTANIKAIKEYRPRYSYTKNKCTSKTWQCRSPMMLKTSFIFEIIKYERKGMEGKEKSQMKTTNISKYPSKNFCHILKGSQYHKQQVLAKWIHWTGANSKKEPAKFHGPKVTKMNYKWIQGEATEQQS